MKLPFLDSDNDLYVNICLILIIIDTLGKTSRGVLKVNNGRLHIFLYLVKNPTFLNKMFVMFNKDTVLLHERDAFSVTSISPNIDPLFDRETLKSLLSISVVKKLVKVVYKKDDGFFYVISEKGQFVVEELKDEYFQEIILLCKKLKSILSISESQLNQKLNQLIRRESN